MVDVMYAQGFGEVALDASPGVYIYLCITPQYALHTQVLKLSCRLFKISTNHYLKYSSIFAI